MNSKTRQCCLLTTLMLEETYSFYFMRGPGVEIPLQLQSAFAKPYDAFEIKGVYNLHTSAKDSALVGVIVSDVPKSFWNVWIPPIGIRKAIKFLDGISNTTMLDAKYQLTKPTMLEFKWQYPKDIPTSSSKWYAYLLSDQKNKVVGFAQGKIKKNSSEIDRVEILLSYRGRKLCSPFITEIMHALANIGMQEVLIENDAAIGGEKCYTKAGQDAYFDYLCQRTYNDLYIDSPTITPLSFKNSDICYSMRFRKRAQDARLEHEQR